MNPQTLFIIDQDQLDYTQNVEYFIDNDGKDCLIIYEITPTSSNINLVDNQIWNAVFAIEQGYAYRRSMTCRDMGFQFGRIMQGLLAFEIPDEILFGEVSAWDSNYRLLGF